MSRPSRESRRGAGAGATVIGWTAALSAAAGAGWGAAAADAAWRHVLAGACAAAVVLMTAGILVLARRLSAERAHRTQEAGVADARGAEVAHLAAVRVPAIVERLHTGRRLDGVPGPLAPPERTGAEFARALDSVVVTLGSDAALHRERALRDSVQTALNPSPAPCT
ncbi:ATP-binding protein [Streptomyces californicus]